MTKPVIEVKDLAKSFGENDVLKDITEKVEPGQVIVVIGPTRWWSLCSSRVIV